MTARHIVGIAVLPYKGWAPFCLRCTTDARMKLIARLHWKCDCGAEHTGTCSWLRNDTPEMNPNATREP